MKIYTKAGDLAFKTFTFPDGQPHFKLETYEIEFKSVHIETAIRNPAELFQVLAVSDVLHRVGYTEINLDIRYLLGARMDRAIDLFQPFTLDVVARLINGAGFSKVRILDVHSEVATRLVRNSENVLPMNKVLQSINSLGGAQVVIPDKGAIDRVMKMLPSCLPIKAHKNRDMATGALSGFGLDHAKINSEKVIIIDDICDGGGTFIGLAKELRKAGAKKVYLYVTHGIFSKGLPLEGIDQVYTTDSYYQHGNLAHGQGFSWSEWPTVIPISMKDMK